MQAIEVLIVKDPMGGLHYIDDEGNEYMPSEVGMGSLLSFLGKGAKVVGSLFKKQDGGSPVGNLLRSVVGLPKPEADKAIQNQGYTPVGTSTIIVNPGSSEPSQPATKSDETLKWVGIGLGGVALIGILLVATRPSRSQMAGPQAATSGLPAKRKKKPAVE